MKMKMFVLFLIVQVSQHALCQQQVRVTVGGTAVLPCQVPAPVDPEATVEWSCDMFSPAFVHVRRQGSDLPTSNERYRGRTALRNDAVDTGQLDLTLRNTNYCDSATYTCIVRKDGQVQQEVKVQLQVKDQHQVIGGGLTAGEITGICFGVFFAFVSGLIIGFILRPRCYSK